MVHNARFRIVLEGTYSFDSNSPDFDSAAELEKEILEGEPDLVISDAEDLKVEVELEKL